MLRRERFTLGIEEEFQLVDAQTGALTPALPDLLAKGVEPFGQHIKPENMQAMVELVSGTLPDLASVREHAFTGRRALSQLAAQAGLALISAGTHPYANWRDQPITESGYHAQLLEEYQDVLRADLIFGLHIHVGIENKELAVSLMNQLRTWLPHLLALAANSPFWVGHLTGIKAYRAIQWRRFPRSGIPYAFHSYSDFEHYIQELISMGCIHDGRRLSWDMRIHPDFGTLECRICDMPLTLDDTLALTALWQAIVVKLAHLYEQGKAVPIWKSRHIEENRWRAARYGLDAEFVDFSAQKRMSMREALSQLLDFVDDVIDQLGSHREMEHIRTLLNDPRGTGADRQIACYKESGDIQQVLHFLMQQSLQGL
ncbi:carboxylate-amine ligase [Ktedonosporobacter rubrisoli]|uniref:Putative glutamate--cysteine ligase 2 n=1 Tax=Ktedonosporobacter rubrisoli TaxID=2509675 RepID=A0A4P6JNZ0_KTERU|nr:carboxylate-amine ligase [Ktedonosporobacter rubrisoli]QBD77048.1 carboxylate-amine ligase [Ktedonosporobacter rubrisoli]